MRVQEQEPVAIVGFACRLPGGNNTPEKLWEFLERGDIASRQVPESRFTFESHYDGSLKPGTMRPPGGMYLGGGVDPVDFDAGFFEISGADAVSMDPNQRQMLEVVFEGLENGGLTLDRLSGESVACFVGSFATDYGDIQNRDPLDRAANHVIGIGRASMANRLSYFLNIKGPSVTLDTACSGSMVGVHLAVRALHNGEANAAIVATSNIYLNPEHVQDVGSLGQAHSPTGLCHTFDISADGYIKSEAVSAIIVKRLADAIRDEDPIRAVIRGTASTSNGRTNGLASPSSEAQASAIRQAYASAGISDFNATAYLECHGTGTPAGDPIEVNGAGSVFASTRSADNPLIIGSIKANIGHSEPAAGSSGVIKAVMAIERGLIPGTPSFINPNPKIDFIGNRVRASRKAIPWPDMAGVARRASVNSFGYGGSNAHAIVEQAPSDRAVTHVSSYLNEDAMSFDDEYDLGGEPARPYTLVLSANDLASLRANIENLCTHLINPRVRVDLADLAYTLAERRSRFWHRAFVTTRSTELDVNDFIISKKSHTPPRLGFVFTGQGAQWPQMGKDLLEYFPQTRVVLRELDDVLQSLPNPPTWSLIAEMSESRTSEHLRQPEFSQPIVTALQIAILDVLKSWGVTPSSVVGHSSGEIAAAYAANLLDRADAIKAAFYRGRAAVNKKDDADVGMLAVGLGTEAIAPFLDELTGQVWIACYNSPNSLTISGWKEALQTLAIKIKAAGHFARLLQVDLAYHSGLMDQIGGEYEILLNGEGKFHAADLPTSNVGMFSSVTGLRRTELTDALYWKTNMVSPVRFNEALAAMVSDPQKPTVLIEIGPSGALAGPVSQVLKTQPNASNVQYVASWARGAGAAKALYDVAGRLFNAGVDVNLARVNESKKPKCVIVDLPNYSWNHSVKYWFEPTASVEWRFKKYLTHDLIGSKVLSGPWQSPTWRKRLDLADVPWLRDHVIGSDVLMPAAGYVAMALEAMYQKHYALLFAETLGSANDLAYRFRNVRFDRALVLKDRHPVPVILSLAPVPGSADWHEFRVSTEAEDGTVRLHCFGSVRVQETVEEPVSAASFAPLESPTQARLWYKAQNEIGLGFGPAFQNITSIETTSGQRSCRARLSMTPPKSKWNPQSYYPVHPAVLDACFQSSNPALVAGERSNIQDIMIPSVIDDILINRVPNNIQEGIATAEAIFTGRGRKEQLKSYFANISLSDPEKGRLLVRVRGMHLTQLDMGPSPDPHTFHCVSWKPDITLLTEDQLVHLNGEDGVVTSKLDSVIDLVAHKKPTLSILEVNMNQNDTSSLWFKDDDSPIRMAYSRYDFASTSAKALVSVQMQYESKLKTSFHLANPHQAVFGITTGALYDLAIVKSERKAESSAKDVVSSLAPLLKPEAFTLLVSLGSKRLVTSEAIADTQPEDELSSSVSGPDTPSTSQNEFSASENVSDTANSSVISVPQTVKMAAKIAQNLNGSSHVWNRQTLRRLAKGDGLFTSIIEVGQQTDGGDMVFLGRGLNKDGVQNGPRSEARDLVVLRLDTSTPELAPSLQSKLQESGWKITQRSSQLLSTDYAPNVVVLILDELCKPVLTHINGRRWNVLKQLVSSGMPVLWVTKGAQHHRVTDPDRAMVYGLFRVVRREDPTARLTVLDVQSGTSPAATWAINQVLRLLQRRGVEVTETEFVERDGILHTQRVMPDVAVNAFKHAEVSGNEPVIKGLHETPVKVHIHSERVGTLDFAWCEEELAEPEVESGFVEVEVKTIGVNFKDVATTMGIVPENEHTIGCECAGIVKRVGAGLDNFHVGDRVCVMSKGTYANRVRVPAGRVHSIPPWMSFEEAATIPLVYMTSFYSLFHLGNLQEGQSVLIHSATGGVGLAAIQLAQYKKAELFVTVGTDEKRDFLMNTFGIPASHIFSSRNAKFAEQVMSATNGRGVDVVLNSLIGELLDASWRICADGGTMVEIGKRDIVNRNCLSMEPFDRNCSFRAIDLSYTNHFTPEKSAMLLDEIFDLVDGGHIKPIHPIVTYGFDAVPAALAYIRRGQHIGKIIITNGDKEDVQLPIRPAMRQVQLQPDASFLIVGGLKGLCGSLAIQMAHQGARHIISCSRSGINDEASARIVRNCRALGCEVTEARGDVTDAAFIRNVFKTARPGIAGVIQGAMVLRDKPYETMTVEEYHQACEPKVRGTWNLHRASQEVEVQKRPLEFFTMLSSVSGVIGNKGQSNYAAANTFLDAFASYRKSLGLAANTVDLGMIQDVGYLAEEGASLEARFDTRQWTPINEAVLRRILGYSILQQDPRRPLSAASSSNLITGIAYPLQAASSDLVDDARFSYLFGGGGAGNGDLIDGGGSKDEAEQAARAFRMMAAQATNAADTAALVAAAVDLLSAQIVNIMRLETEIEPGKPLIAYGIDSLSAVEIRGWARTKLGAELSTLDIMNASSILALGDTLAAKAVPAPVVA